MKVLIISDTHGKTDSIRDVLEKVGDIDMLIHLGDVCGDEEYIYDNCSCPVHMVAGNNDWGSDLPKEEEFMIGDLKVFITHGHKYNVHYGTDLLQELIKFQGYDIVMYGHTHIQNVERYGGSYIINPGSLALPRDGMEGKFILMDIDQHGKPFFAENEMTIRRKKQQSFWEEFWDKF